MYEPPFQLNYKYPLCSSKKTNKNWFANGSFKLGPHDAWFVFVMRHASWFAHCVYEKTVLIWVDVSFVYSSHLVCQLGGKLTHQSKLYVSNSTNLFDTFLHDAPRIRIAHRVDPALQVLITQTLCSRIILFASVYDTLCIAIMLRSNFLHLVTSSQTALVIRHSAR